MTRDQVIVICAEVQALPYCIIRDADGYGMPLTCREYNYEMLRERPWTMPNGEEAWYDDGASEELQDVWYRAVRLARHEVGLWEVAHKGSIPLWATKFCG